MVHLSPPVDPGPDEAPLRDVIADRLEAAGADRSDAEWLADTVLDLAHQQASEARRASGQAHIGAMTEPLVDAVEAALLDARSSRDARILGALYRLAQVPAQGRDGETTELRAFASLVHRACALTPPIRFFDGLVEVLWEKQERRPDLDRVAFDILLAQGRLTTSELKDLREPAAARLRALRQSFDRATDDWAGHHAWGAMEPMRAGGATGRNSPERTGLNQELLNWVAAIEERLERHPDDDRLRGSLWIAALSVEPGELDSELRQRVLDVAARHVAHLRNDDELRFARTVPECEGQAEHDRNAITVVARLGGHWRAIKSALLLLRSLRAPAVAPDLRYWLEPRDRGGVLPTAPPVDRLWITDSVANLFHEYASSEKQRDTDLRDLRSEFARFCLDRLRSRHKSGDLPTDDDGAMLEPSPDWRRAYIRAIRELRVNPGGRGHRVLHWVSKNDPHEELRGEAATAYRELTRRTMLPPGTSPRRALFAAYWHLRVAHLQAIGHPVDETGATRTRQKETRRVKEVERNDA